ncbi:hypothetical protein GGI00_001195 [Coemansia sp. RSA 2681]|nr:hypothetical protein GGI00_001195 [Coemansia sp. RSA 2681]
MPRLAYALVAYTVVLLYAAVVLEALPLPQGADSLPSAALPTIATPGVEAPSSTAGSTSGESAGMTSSTRYYVLAISICGASFALFTVAMLYRLKTRHRHDAAATAAATAGGLEQNPDASGAARDVPLQHILPKARVVLSEAQFNMLPRKLATGPVLSSGTKRSASSGHSPTARADSKSNSAARGTLPLLAEPESCSICLSSIKAGDPLVFLVPCHHAFHDECVGQWLMQKSTLCPLCKCDLVKGLNLGATRTSSDLAGSDNTQVLTVTVADSPSPQTLHLAEEYEHRLL